ncbi:MAG TPA: hypothetical protein VM537_28570 [Anaerolineae bacterium]|nr:hypothetical protein [Anaerolineae bacterium]
MDQAQHKILHMIQDGAISAEEAERLLAAMDIDESPDDPSQEEAEAEQPPSAAAETKRRGAPGWWRRVWPYVMGAGLTLAGVAVVFTVPIARGDSSPGWLACTLPLMIFGILLAALTWWSRTAPWVHVRVREENQRVNISLPLPLGLAAWGVRVARPWVPQLRETAVDEVLLSLADMDFEGQEMLVVEVDDDETGEKVEVRIG